MSKTTNNGSETKIMKYAKEEHWFFM